MSELAQKLHPNRFTEMSPFMAAITGYVLGESWTDPQIAEITVSEQEDLIYIRKVGGVGFDGVHSVVSHGNLIIRKLHGSASAKQGRSFSSAPNDQLIVRHYNSLTDLRNNWNRLLDAAGLTEAERHEAVKLFCSKVAPIPGTTL